MTQNAAVAPGGTRRRAPGVWSVLRIVLVLCWVCWAVLSWWTMPRESGVERARADLAAGRVTAYDWAEGWGDGNWTPWETPELRTPGPEGRMFVWRTTDWRIHYAVPDRGPVDAPADGAVDVSQAVSLRQAVERAAVSQTGPDDGPAQTMVTLLTIGLSLSFLLVLVSYSTPVTGTRWYWWWLVLGVPAGLGLLYWLARERPWSRSARSPAGPPGRETRRRWHLGIAVAILASIAGTVLLAGLNALFGDGLIPVPLG